MQRDALRAAPLLRLMLDLTRHDHAVVPRRGSRPQVGTMYGPTALLRDGESGLEYGAGGGCGEVRT